MMFRVYRYNHLLFLQRFSTKTSPPWPVVITGARVVPPTGSILGSSSESVFPGIPQAPVLLLQMSVILVSSGLPQSPPFSQSSHTIPVNPSVSGPHTMAPGMTKSLGGDHAAAFISQSCNAVTWDFLVASLLKYQNSPSA